MISQTFRSAFRFLKSHRTRILCMHIRQLSFETLRFRKPIFFTPGLSLGLWGFAKKDGSSNDLRIEKAGIIAKADALYENGEYQKLYGILNNYRNSHDDEILWRLSRAVYSLAKTASDSEAKKMFNDAYDIITEALSINPNNWAVHKWMAVIIDKKSSYDGMKARIKELNRVKEHMLKASELNPNDATVLYMLGHWCYSVSDLAWYQRKIASTIFGKVPDSSFEEALQYFKAAEKVEPMFYGDNLLFLGKTYLKLNQKDEAIKYLKMAAEYPAKNDDDHKAKQEATKILGTLH
ncbi:regulator of microtubule dynamics protein 1-like [Chelonus insularis]|uniref:regulator of microtubule dynamics protein 1-like n=1 Tax=Chelonus insularis TaxID=460826 RepID=UPI00158E3086|nr:regulator of microtubule dynamics protein 1-like [Chelonus insularis]